MDKTSLAIIHDASCLYKQPFFKHLGFTKVLYGILFLLVYHQYSLVNEIGPHINERLLPDDTNVV